MKNSEYAFMITKSGGVIGRYDSSRLEALPYYLRLYAMISKSFRYKYIDVKPFEIEVNEELD
ncbi:hypothetical protein Phi19:1_gp079 [Cellulophaga phage phi19:1]|uniref:Uncharacterized protein n=1 Tax=Cellulophaga phage phi19:1 TaxID=1327970 RepID=R9ZVZ9_9CAUD|nr:hypothetical protein Phi19:1_gp079 [Cellulophaga phage phi19:1]AGO47369.1 hypothetical protein Phi19:1_gp079 [Cellulophaga phage phi19:1]